MWTTLNKRLGKQSFEKLVFEVMNFLIYTEGSMGRNNERVVFLNYTAYIQKL